MSTMDKERFSMLLLEPGEIFFQDYSVRMKLNQTSDGEKYDWMDGRLKLCSKSLVFVNKDINEPLIKLQMKEIISIECVTDENNESGNVLTIACKQYAEMLRGNRLEPYKFIHKKVNFLLSFNYANPDDCLPHIMQLLRASTLPTAEQNAMIMIIVHSRQSRFNFDTSWLEDLYEQVVFEVQASKVLPLIINPGRVLLTNSRIYFQPYNNLDQERYDEMSGKKFLYGSHYSAPGFVLFYLVRKYPQYMLCLQNGRFDHPDRMFNNVADVWKNVLANMSDFKELVPEFYDPSNNGDFLVNNYGIDFGFRFDGTKVNDVLLPPWANGPGDFVKKLRDALESDWVSENLHHWIDLIFGYKQRGAEAEKANNVFFHLCYEGAVDLDTIQDINDRHALEVQIMEFGQIPKQVFTLPHPKRLVNTINFLSADLSSCQLVLMSESKEDEANSLSLEQYIVFSSHKDVITNINFMGDSENIASVGQDGVLKIYSMSTKKLTRSISLSNLPLSSCIFYKTKNNQSILVVGSWDNTLIFYDVEFGKIIDVLMGHEDAVSSLELSPTKNIFISGSWDCTVKIWHSYESGTKIKPHECLIAQLDHDSKVTCLSISKDEKLLVSGTEDGEIFLWNMDTYNLHFMVKDHESKINAMTFDLECKNIISCASDKLINVFDIQTSTRIYSTSLDNEPMAFGWNGPLLLVGDDKGYLSFWDSHGASFKSKIQCHKGPLTAIIITTDNKFVITGGNDKKIIVWNCHQ
ncbi:GSCOCG00009552001-RA-CDS [Cotesia congregata]|nr:GSCOCG00009552001-RA-CDS [Cotesia congregata]